MFAAHPDPTSVFRKKLSGKDIPCFEMITEDGQAHRFGCAGGNGGDAGEVAFRVAARNRKGSRALASFDELKMAEAYMYGDLDVEGDFLSVLDLREHFSDFHPLLSLWRHLRPLLFSQVKTDKKLVPNHYDRGNEFYFSFLDKEVKLYSQAVFYSEDESLERAARNKLDYIKRLCRLDKGSRVLDVGAGWGSFSRFAAQQGMDVSMLTVSKQQYAYLDSLAKGDGLEGTLQPVLESVYAYDADKQYDAVVILGVMEHLPDYQNLFRRFREIVKPNGRVYMDFVAGRKKFNISTFTYRYVFEGNHSPVVMPDLFQAANDHDFEIVEVINDRHSYFLTLKRWAENLEAVREKVSKEFGQATYRLFQMYLWAAAHDLNRKGELESYRVVFENSIGLPSHSVGL